MAKHYLLGLGSRVASRTYVVTLTRAAPPVYPDDATLWELVVAPAPSARLAPPFSQFRFDYELFVPHREPSVSAGHSK